MSMYGASGLMGQWLESQSYGAVPGGPIFQAETGYGAVPGGASFLTETGYGAVPGGASFLAEARYGAVPGGASFLTETGYGADEPSSIFGALDSSSLQSELAYGADEEDYGGVDVLLEEELFGAVPGGSTFLNETAYGAEPGGNVYASEIAYGADDEEVFGAFEKATAKGRIAKLYRISARIQYLVDMGQVDVAREKAKKLLGIWAKLAAMPDAQPLISAALQDEMARLSAFASGQTNNPHDAGAVTFQPGVAVDPTMTGGSASIFSTNVDALYSDPSQGAVAAPVEYAPVIAPVVAPVPVYPRPLYAPPPRRPFGPAFRRPVVRKFGALEEDYGAMSASSTHTYQIRRGPGKGMQITSTLDKAAFGRCRRLAGNLRKKEVAYVGNGTFKAKGGHTFTIQDASFLQECSRVSKIADKGQSFGLYGNEA